MIKQILKKGVKFPLLLVKQQKVKTELSKIKLHESSKVKAIGDILHEVLFEAQDSKEQEVSTLIEQRRSHLLSSQKEISVIDYGAGNSDSKRTKEEMKNGVPSKVLVADVCKASKIRFWAELMFKLVRILKPLSCIELGSCVGISAAYQGFGLKLNGKGHLTTLEGSPEVANIAKETVESLGLNNTSVVIGPFHETLKDVLESSKPVDFLFNDGHHDHDAVIEYFNTAIPYLADDAVVVFDDIDWSSGMKKAWQEIENDKRVVTSIDLGAIGIVLIGDGSANKTKFTMPRMPL